MSLNLEAAEKEIAEKGYKHIQIETAWKWASRAVVQFKRVKSSNVVDIMFYVEAEQYYDEALEHAAQSGSNEIIIQINKAVNPFKNKAFKKLLKKG